MRPFGELGIPCGFLTDKQIRLALEQENLIVPGSWDPNCIRHASYTMRLGNTVEIARANKANLEDRRDFVRLDLVSGEYFDLKPGDTAKLFSVEMLRLPDRVLGFTVARGLMFFEALLPENTYVDPGFNGSLYTTVTNLSQRTVRLRHNDPIARLFFYNLSEPVQEPYQQGAAKGLSQRLESFRATKLGTPEECRSADSEALVKELAQIPTAGNQLVEFSRRQARRWIALCGFSACWPVLLILANGNIWIAQKVGFVVRNISAIGFSALISFLSPKIWGKFKRL